MAILKANPLPWLLEKDNPSVRYLALTEIMDLPPSHPEASEAKAAIMESGTVPNILAKQNDQGRWLLENTFNGRFAVNIEQKGKPSKWVTLNAIRALRAYFGLGKTPRHDTA